MADLPFMPMARALLLTLAIAAWMPLGCGDGGGDHTAVVTTELTTEWEMLPHRLSLLEIAFDPSTDATAGTLYGQNEGGGFGAVDSAVVRQAFAVARSPHLRTVALSVEIEVPPTGTTDPEDFVASGTARTDATPLDGAEPRVAWIRGYRISTDEYDTPPAFEAAIPYDPAEGFTTQGIGIQLGDPTLDGPEVTVPVTVRNSLGPSDRADMNAAIPQASSWVRVDLVVVGVTPGVEAATATSEVGYFLSTAEYGTNTVHPHAPDAEQELVVSGTAGLESGLVGLRGFDLWLNVPGRIDPACTVVQDELNFADEMVSGPGRYVTKMTARLWGTDYAADTGQATTHVDLYLSNSSDFTEVGNICLGTRGEVSLLQIGGEARSVAVEPVDVPLTQGTRAEATIELPAP